MKRWMYALLALTWAGLLFSSYLSAVKLFSNSCAFNEPCPYFLGYPACWYGFGMYLLMFIATAWGLKGMAAVRSVLKFDIIVSVIGIIFAGRFAAQELLHGSLTGTLGLSTCVYGLIFYVAIFATSVLAFRELRHAN